MVMIPVGGMAAVGAAAVAFSYRHHHGKKLVSTSSAPLADSRDVDTIWLCLYHVVNVCALHECGAAEQFGWLSSIMSGG